MQRVGFLQLELTQLHVCLRLPGLETLLCSARHHHIDVQQLPSGEWIAAIDGDSVGSGAVQLWRLVHAFVHTQCMRYVQVCL